MIRITMYGEDYEQDMKPLIKSFYPHEELLMLKSKQAAAIDKTECSLELCFELEMN